MKTITLLLSSLLILDYADAQIGKGTLLPGLDVNYTSSTQTYYNSTGAKISGDAKTTNFALYPNLGYFVSDHLLVGAEAEYISSKTVDSFTGANGLTPRSSTKYIGGVARYYASIGEKVFFFMQFSILTGKGTMKQTGFDPQSGSEIIINNPTTFFQTGFRPGIVYFITKRIGIEGTFGFLGYNRTKATNDAANSNMKNITSNVGLTINSSTFNLGIRYYIPRKKQAE